MLQYLEIKCVIGFLVILSACTSAETENESMSSAEATALQLTEDQEDGSVLITPVGAFLDKNIRYKAFAERVLETSPLPGPSTVQAARLNSLALRQTLYPQFTPAASVNQDGNPVARLSLSQIVFSNGKFQAEKQLLRTAEIEALADYLIDANQRVADALLAYAEIDYHRQFADVALQLDKKYTDLVTQSERRVSGGVGDQSEVETFKLKQLEARADLQDSRMNQKLADQRVRDLTAGLPMPHRPPPVQLTPALSEPPELILLIAQAEGARGRIASERAKRRPSVSIEAFTERDLETGITDDGMSIGVGVSVPLGLRNDLEIQAAEAELAGATAELETTKRDIARRLSQLRTQIQRDMEQIGVLNELVAAAEVRVDGFTENFLSGSVSLEEAVSVLETYKRAKTNLVQTENDIFSAKIEIARTSGQLLPAGN